MELSLWELTAAFAAGALSLLVLGVILGVSEELKVRKARSKVRHRATGGQGLSSIYLTASDVHAVMGFAHFIPMARGYTRAMMEHNYPGWQWNDISQAVQAVSAAYPHHLRAGTVGLLLHTDGVVDIDEEDLSHPAKGAHQPFTAHAGEGRSR